MEVMLAARCGRRSRLVNCRFSDRLLATGEGVANLKGFLAPLIFPETRDPFATILPLPTGEGNFLL